MTTNKNNDLNSFEDFIDLELARAEFSEKHSKNISCNIAQLIFRDFLTGISDQISGIVSELTNLNQQIIAVRSGAVGAGDDTVKADRWYVRSIDVSEIDETKIEICLSRPEGSTKLEPVVLSTLDGKALDTECDSSSGYVFLTFNKSNGIPLIYELKVDDGAYSLALFTTDNRT